MISMLCMSQVSIFIQQMNMNLHVPESDVATKVKNAVQCSVIVGVSTSSLTPLRKGPIMPTTQVLDGY